METLRKLQKPLKKLLYTTAEAKAVIGCGTTRLYELLANGKLRARRLGHSTMIEAVLCTSSLTLCRASSHRPCGSGHPAIRNRSRSHEADADTTQSSLTTAAFALAADTAV
jgi:hypothetical protein